MHDNPKGADTCSSDRRSPCLKSTARSHVLAIALYNRSPSSYQVLLSDNKWCAQANLITISKGTKTMPFPSPLRLLTNTKNYNGNRVIYLSTLPFKNDRCTCMPTASIAHTRCTIDTSPPHVKTGPNREFQGEHMKKIRGRSYETLRNLSRGNQADCPTLAPTVAEISWELSCTTGCMSAGQRFRRRSHLRMHSVWKACRQGRTASLSPSS